jgi:precorrin-6B C5,15-methyltransferase / cobalt-precorrin-6B C5,C15-methyltransferase
MRMRDEPMSSAAPDCTSRRWLSIIGIGEDGVDGLSPVARRLIGDAELVVGGRRHLQLADTIIGGERLPWPSPMDGAYAEIERRRGRSVAVLASGDPFHYGVGSVLASRFSADEMLSIPQPSAFSLAASRMGWALQETALVSLHGRALERIIPHLQPGARILALTWDETTPESVARLLATRGMGRSRITVLEALGGPRERIRSAEAEAFDLSEVNPLNTIAVEIVAEPGTMLNGLAPGLDDIVFEHDGQLTKREIRAVTLSALSPRHGERLWDIGLGAGSIAIEWLLQHPSLKAIGIEERADRASRAARNAASLGVPELEIVTGRAPEALSNLEAPDAVFIGGGMSDTGVFETAWAALKPGGRLVANAVSLETEALLLKLFAVHGGELIRLQVARAESVGTMTGWRPAMPVTQWRVRKP